MKFNKIFWLNYVCFGYFIALISALIFFIVISKRRKDGKLFESKFDRCLFALLLTTSVYVVFSSLTITTYRQEKVLSPIFSLIFTVALWMSLALYVTTINIRSAPVIDQSEYVKYFSLLARLAVICFGIDVFSQSILMVIIITVTRVQWRGWVYILQGSQQCGAVMSILALMILDILYIHLFMQDIQFTSVGSKNVTKRRAQTITRHSLVCVCCSFTAGLFTPIQFIEFPLQWRAVIEIFLMLCITLIPIILVVMKYRLFQNENDGEVDFELNSQTRGRDSQTLPLSTAFTLSDDNYD
ncbi:hypothetical protein MP228_007747 [Amoeboaphelidium protococcarum]|nr:hypothetical protein MP228_007747 [Amoeboaphelidium protococcarum]